MSTFARTYLIACGIVAAIGALLHVAILVGGPDWYAFFGAPAALVQMARDGHPRAAISCLVIAGVLSVFAAYAFSGAGIIRRLPVLRTVLAAIGAVLIVRGLVFIPLILIDPRLLARICDCRRIDTFIVVTSVLCLALGIGYALGAWAASRRNATASRR